MEPKKYNYWKKPWGPLAVLAAGVLQLILAIQLWGDYRNVQRVADHLFTPEQYVQYSNSTLTQILLLGLAAVTMFSLFFIGVLSRRASQARRLELILMSVLAVAVLGWTLSPHAAAPAILLVVLVGILVCIALGLREYKRAKEQENQA